MVDPIDRNELLEYVWRCRLDSRERIDELVRSMPTLPSAQSEPLKIIIDHEAMAEELERIKQAMRNTPVMLLPSAQPEQRWIPCSERMPGNGDEVLVCYDFKGQRSVLIGTLCSDEKFHGFDDEYLTPDGRKYRKAVAWMPLPEPYREEGEQDG